MPLDVTGLGGEYLLLSLPFLRRKGGEEAKLTATEIGLFCGGYH